LYLLLLPFVVNKSLSMECFRVDDTSPENTIRVDKLYR